MASASQRRRAVRALSLAAVCSVPSLFAVDGARAAVVHRYSFNDGTANDSLNTANGTLINGATVSGGQLVTAGGGSGAAGTAPGVSLPAASVANLTGDFSIETFFTRTAASQNFPTLFNFAAGATDTNNYVIATPSRNATNVPSVAYKQAGVNGGAEVILTGATIPLSSTAYLATTFNAGTATMYVNGAPTSQSALLTGFNLSTKGVKAGIHSQAPFGDVGLAGSNDEFRIHDNSLSGRTVALNFLSGPESATIVPANGSTATGDYNAGAFATTPAATEVVIVNNGHTVTLSAGTGNAGLLEVASGGTLTVAGGTLAPATSLNVVSGGTVNVNAGGTLSVRGILADGEAAGPATGTRVLNLNGGTLFANTSFVAGGGLTTNLAGVSTIDTNNAPGNGVLVAGPIAGAGSLNKAGLGTLTLTGSTAAHTGAVNVNAGTLAITPPAARTTAGGSPFANPITFSAAAAGTLVLSQANAIDLTGGVTLPAPAAATVYSITVNGTANNANFSSPVTGGNANSTLNLTGFFQFGNAGNNYAGRTQFNGGTSVQVGLPQAFGTSTLVFNNGGIQNTADLNLTNPYTFGATPAAFFNAAGAPNAARTTELSGAGTLVTGNNTFAVAQPTVTLSGVVSGPGTILKNGVGTLVLSGNNTFTGNFAFPTGTANSGAIRLASNNAAGTGAKTIALPGDNAAVQTLELTGGITVSNLTINTSGRNGSPVNFRNVSGNNTFGGAYNITGTGGGYAIESLAGRLTMTGPVANTLTSARAVDLRGAGDGEISGVISDTPAVTTGPMGITKSTGAGTWTLSGANTYTGGTSVAVGELGVAGANGRLGTGNVTITAGANSHLRVAAGVLDGINNAATLSLSGGGTAGTADQGYALLEAGVNETVGGLTLGGVAQTTQGTYGSTTSGAMFQNDEFFSGPGVVTFVPEPASAGLFALAAAGLLGRRRRRRRHLNA